MTKVYGASFARNWTARLMCGAAGAVLLTAGAVHAQEATAPAAAGDQSAPVVVTITAERRAENLQKVPISATVRTGAELKAEGVYGIQSLQNQTPGLSIQPPVSGETYINIRGVGIQQTSPVSSNGVAFYVDGMYVPSLIDTVDTFYDLQNVEVLRGPQGTLVGSNADGGAIFVNSVQPSFDRVKGYIQQTIGNYNDYRTEGGINMPITDNIAARVAFVHETRDSFTTNVGAQAGSPYGPTNPAAQNQPGNVDFSAARLQVAFKPTDNFELTVRFEPYESRTDGFAEKPYEAALGPLATYFYNACLGSSSTTCPPAQRTHIVVPNFNDPWAVAHQNDPFLVDYDTPQYVNIEGQRTSGTLVWHLTPNIELKDIVSFQTGYQSEFRDLDQDSAPDGTQLRAKSTYTDYTEEVNLLSTSSSPLQWVAGFYYMNTTGPLQFNSTSPAQPAGSPLSVTAYHQAYAGFVSLTYQFTPVFSVTAGGRYSYDSLPYLAISPPLGTHTATDSEPTGNLKLNFQATPQTLIYASVSNGYKAGGMQLLPPVPYKPETNVVGELGLKTDFLEHHVRFDGDFFYGQYANYQVLEDIALGPTLFLPYVQTPGAATTWGFEGELTGQFRDLKFDAGVSYLSARSDKLFSFTGPAGDSIPIPAGTVLPYAPDFTLTAGIQYGFHVWNGLLTPRLQYQYQDVQYSSLLHVANGLYNYALAFGTTIPAHGTWDFLLTYAAPEHWQIQGYITNFTNVAYISNSLLSPASGDAPELSYGAPIQYGVRLSYNF